MDFRVIGHVLLYAQILIYQHLHLSVSANIYKTDTWRFLWLVYPLISWQAIVNVAVQVYDMLLGLLFINF